MKLISLPAGRHRAFTLVELLTVIAIIAILAALLLPAIVHVKVIALKTKAKTQIHDIATAIENYESIYSRFPVSSNAQANAINGCYTYGGFLPDNNGGGMWPSAVPANFQPTNTEVMAILMDITNTTVTSVNQNHQKNPQRTLFLNAPLGDANNTNGVVGPDLVYRDPWGNPYIISMDLNEDNQCLDAFYCSSTVSGPNNPGINGLNNPDGSGNNFRFHGNVMVWSAGPDGKIDSGKAANQGANKDNIVSWVQ